jgi:mycothiol synthase
MPIRCGVIPAHWPRRASRSVGRKICSVELLRPLQDSDIEDVVAVYGKAWGEARPIDKGELALWLRDPGVDVENLRVLEVDGVVIGYGDLAEIDGKIALEVAAPGHWEVFLDWAEATARATRRSSVRTLSYYEASELAEVAARRGYVLWRSSLTMRIDFAAQPPEQSPTPSGIDLGAYDENDQPFLRAALNRIFEQDPFYVAMTPAQFQLFYLDDPGMDPRLWTVARDASGEIVGFALGFSEWHGDDTIGEVRSVGVVPQWRNQGIGEAVVRQTLRELHAHGVNAATLGVDAGNETHAARLYERVGMRVTARHDNWAIDLTRT